MLHGAVRFDKCTESCNHDHNQDSEQFNTLPPDALGLTLYSQTYFFKP